MDDRTRRQALALGGTALVGGIAGCLSEDDDPDDGSTDAEESPTESSNAVDTESTDDTDDENTEGADDADSESDDSQTQTQTETLIDDSDTVSGGQWIRWEFWLNREAELELRTTVRSGPAIDVIVTTQEEFEQYEQGNRFRFNSELSQMDTVGETTTTTLPAGDEYVLLLDNTSAGEASPSSREDVAEVDLTLVGTG